MKDTKKHWLEILLILFLFTVALFTRIYLARSTIQNGYQFVMGDDDDYHRLALSVLTTGTLSDNGIYAYHMPVFPLFLAVIYFVAGPNPTFAMMVLIVLSSLTCVGVYWLGRKWFGITTGFIAGFLYAIDLDLALYSQFLLTETITITLVLLALFVLEYLFEKPNWKLACVSGILLALLALVRVNYGLFILSAIALFLYYHRVHFHSVLRYALLISGIVCFAWLLWMGRNYMVLGTFIPFTSQAGNGYYGVYNDSAANCRYQ